MRIVRKKGVTETVRRIFIVAMLFMSLMSRGQELAVDSQRDSDADFREYKTYFWASQVEKQFDEGGFFLNDLLLKADVRDEVHSQLEHRGYRMDAEAPDLLVNFRVFDRKVNLKGRYDYGVSYWKNDEILSNEILRNEIKLEPGTLIISLLDRRSGKVVWQGAASGLFRHGEFIKDEGKVREAVEKIFESYGYRASIYTRR